MIEPIGRLTDSQLDDLRRLYEQCWWTQNRNAAQVRRIVDNSDIIVAFCDTESERLVAFSRVVTDFMVKAFILDVIVDSRHRQQGLGKLLIDAVVAHPAVQMVRHFELYCRPELVPFDERWGFTASLKDLRFMRLVKSDDGRAERRVASPMAVIAHSKSSQPEIMLELNAPVCDDVVHLFKAAWRDDAPDAPPAVESCLTHSCAYSNDQLVGFVKLAWDGGIDAFLLDKTVHPDYQRRGIGRNLVARAVQVAVNAGIEWVHAAAEAKAQVGGSMDLPTCFARLAVIFAFPAPGGGERPAADSFPPSLPGCGSGAPAGPRWLRQSLDFPSSRRRASNDRLGRISIRPGSQIQSVRGAISCAGNECSDASASGYNRRVFTAAVTRSQLPER